MNYMGQQQGYSIGSMRAWSGLRVTSVWPTNEFEKKKGFGFGLGFVYSI